MGIFGKLAFWKKKDDFGLDKDFGKDLGLDKDLGMDIGQGSPDLGMDLGQQPMQKYPSFQQNQQSPFPSFPSQPSFQPQQSFQSSSNDSFIAPKNLEVISSKLNALRASIESINQRLANIEAIARGEEDNRRKRYY